MRTRRDIFFRLLNEALDKIEAFYKELSNCLARKKSQAVQRVKEISQRNGDFFIPTQPEEYRR